MWKVLVFMFVMLLAKTAVGQPAEYPPILTLPPGDDVIQPLRKNEQAPFAGQLFSVDTAIRWSFWLEQYRVRLPADRKLAEQLHETDRAYWSELLAAEKRRAKAVEDDLRDRLLKTEQAVIDSSTRQWYESPVFGGLVGVLATSLIFGLAVGGIAASS